MDIAINNNSDSSNESLNEKDDSMADEVMGGLYEQGLTPYYAKNDGFNFQEQGHKNRKIAMQQLMSTQEYQAWQEAARTEYACVHAKF